MNPKSSIDKQQGAATLFAAIILLICLTLIALLTAKTVLVETQITADNYRTSQAFSAASAAMDRGVAYFMEYGFDRDGDGNADYVGDADGDGNVDYEGVATACGQALTTVIQNGNNLPFNFPNTTGTQTTYSQFYFDNLDEDPADPDAIPNDDLCSDETENMKRGVIIARGWSDDCTAVRTITQCVGTVGYFKNGVAPEQAWVSKAGLGVNGNGTIINRYTNTNVWSGGGYGGTSAAYDTYVRPSEKQISDYTSAQLDSETTTNAIEVSNNNSGNGFDVITNDAFLSSKTASTSDADLNSTANNQFFDMYFSETKQGIKDMASKVGQLYDPNDSPNKLPDSPPNDVSGLAWVEGDYDLPSLGTISKPVTLVVNGDLTINGQVDFNGIIYVTGDVTGTGIATGGKIRGSIIAEKTDGDLKMSANSVIVFKPWGDGSGGATTPFQKGTGTVIAGTWKDW